MDKKRKQYPTGTRPHGDGIQIKYQEKGKSGYTYATLPWQPSPANIAKAGRLRQSIVAAIRLGTFRHRDFFHDDERDKAEADTFQHYAQTWLDSPLNDWRPQTRYKFKCLLNNTWMEDLADLPLARITHTTIVEALKNAIDRFKRRHGREPSVSIYNNWLTCLSGVFQTAITAGAINRAADPTAEFVQKKRTKSEPDPFDMDEADAIIESIYKHDGKMWGAWFELHFYAGLRHPSEASALTWQALSLRKNEIAISQIRTKHAKDTDGIQKTTKTGIARTVLLNSRAEHAIRTAKKISGFKDNGWIFIQDNGDPVITGDPQRAMFRAAIKRLEIRPREVYCMRHTYATIGLMAGANPGFMASQLGHTIEEFFKTYAKWINNMDNRRQIGIIEDSIGKSGAKVGHGETAKQTGTGPANG